MERAAEPCPWRVRFRDALRLLGQAAAYMPYGALEPILCGASAIELYSGCPEAECDLEVWSTDARELANQLMRLGFRWAERPLQTDRGLWHPERSIGICIAGAKNALTSSEQANMLRVTLELGDGKLRQAVDPWLRVIGIEDLIARHVVRWLERSSSSSTTLSTVQMLSGLGQAGVGGWFRADYLRRRLDYETGGAVVLDLGARGDMPSSGEPRIVSLREMAGIIWAWRLRHGIAFDHSSQGPSTHRCSGQAGRRRDDRWTGNSKARSATIIPFAGVSALPVLSGDQPQER